jgi:gliding motility-associated-like protein
MEKLMLRIYPLFLTIVLFLLGTQLRAQNTACGEIEAEPFNVCTAGTYDIYTGICGSDGVTFSMLSYFLNPISLCGQQNSVLNNPSYFAFVADGSDVFSVLVTPIAGTCNQVGGLSGIQATLIAAGDCATLNPLSNCQFTCTQAPFTLTTFQVPAPGTVILVVLDGCNGSVCDVNFEILSGWTNDPPFPDDFILEQSTILDDGTILCGEVTFTVEPPFEDLCDYVWTLPNGTTIETSDPFITIDVTNLPAGNICVQGVSDCFPDLLFPQSNTVCYPFVPEQLEGEEFVYDTYCGRDDGLVTVDMFTGQPSFTYSWSNGQSGANNFIEDLPPGTYSVTVTDSKGCQLEITNIVVEGSEDIEIEVEVINSGCDTQSGQIIVNASGGTGFGYEYVWTPDVGFGNSAEGLSPGVYTIFVHELGDLSCGSDPLQVEVIIEGELEVTIVQTTPSDCGESDGTVTFTAVGPGNFSYLIEDSQGNFITPPGAAVFPAPVTVSGLPSGNYTLVVTDATTFCISGEISFTIPGTSGPEINAGPDKQLCGTLTTLLEGSLSEGTGQWIQVSGPGTTNFVNINNPNTSITVSEYGVYRYRLTGVVDGCDGLPDEVFVSFFANPEFVFEESCDGDNLIINATILVGEGPFTAGPGSTLSGSFDGNTFTSNPVVGGQSLTLRIVDANGCQSALQSVEHSGLPVLQTEFPVLVVGCGDEEEGDLLVRVDGTFSPDLSAYTFNWSVLSGPGSIEGESNVGGYSGPGVYQLEVVKNGSGCGNTIQIEIVFNQDLPEVSIEEAAVFICTTDSVQLTASSDLGANGTYTWSVLSGGDILEGGNSAVLTVSGPGVYEVQVLNPINGCSNTAQIEVFENVDLPDANAGVDLILNCNDLGEKIIFGTSDLPGAVFQWSTQEGNILTDPNLDQITVDAPGTYFLLVTNPENQCQSLDSMVVIADLDLPLITPPAPLVLNCFNEDQGVEIIVDTNVGEPSFEWTAGSGGQIEGPTGGAQIVAVAPGIYTVEVTNTENGCSSSLDIEVLGDFDLPNANAGEDQSIDCVNVETVLAGGSTTPNVTFQWSGPGILGNPSNAQVTVNRQGTYVLTVTSLENGCSNEDQVFVQSLDDIPVISFEQDELDYYCTSDELTLVASSNVGGGETYNWTVLSGGSVVGGANAPSLVVNGPGIYQVRVFNPANNCEEVAEVVVNDVTQEPDVNAGPDRVISCFDNGSIDISGSSETDNVSYLWSTGNGNIVSAPGSQTVTIDQAGTYTLTVIDNISGCEASASMSVLFDTEAPNVSGPSQVVINCSTEQEGVEITANSSTPNASFEWTSSMGGVILGGSQNNTVRAGSPGNYTVQVFNPANGCTNLLLVTVVGDFEKPDVNAGENQMIDCIDTEAILTGFSSVPGAQYSWSTSNGELQGPLNQPSVRALRSGIYTLRVVNPVNGCFDEDQVEVISVDEEPQAFAGEDIILGCNEFAVASITGNSNFPNVQYFWTTTNGSIVGDPNNRTITIDAPGTYVLRVLDPNTGCDGIDNMVAVATTDLPKADAGEDQELTCSVEEIVLSGLGSTGNNLSYFWEEIQFGGSINNPNSPTITVRSAGLYRLTVRNNQNGCEDIDEVRVFADASVLSAIVVNQRGISCNGANDGSIAITEFVGGVQPFTVFFNGINVGSQTLFSSLSEGTYTIRVLDANGCEVENSFTMINPPVLTVNIGPDLTINKGNSVTLFADIVGRDELASIVWDTTGIEFCLGCREVTFFPSKTMDVGITVVDENGCRATARILIVVKRDLHIFVPNVFSPNGDGRNDILAINAGKEVVRIKSFKIFDRWGSFLYENRDFAPNSLAVGWDGRFQGKQVQAGVYVYTLIALLDDGTERQVSGDVTVVY